MELNSLNPFQPPRGPGVGVSRPSPVEKSSLRPLLAPAALALLVPFVALAALVELRWPPLWTADVKTVDALHGVATAYPLFVLAMKAVSRVGSESFYWVVALVLIAWLAWRKAALSTCVLVVVATSGNHWLNVLVKDLIGRERPVLSDPVGHVGGLSFPSAHAQAAVVGYGLVLRLVGPALGARARRLLAYGCVLAVLMIGFSRVALGAHYPSDVVGGYLLGGAWLGALLIARERISRPSARAPGW